MTVVPATVALLSVRGDGYRLAAAADAAFENFSAFAAAWVAVTVAAVAALEIRCTVSSD